MVQGWPLLLVLLPALCTADSRTVDGSPRSFVWLIPIAVGALLTMRVSGTSAHDKPPRRSEYGMAIVGMAILAMLFPEPVKSASASVVIFLVICLVGDFLGRRVSAKRIPLTLCIPVGCFTYYLLPYVLFYLRPNNFAGSPLMLQKSAADQAVWSRADR